MSEQSNDDNDNSDDDVNHFPEFVSSETKAETNGRAISRNGGFRKRLRQRKKCICKTQRLTLIENFGSGKLEITGNSLKQVKLVHIAIPTNIMYVHLVYGDRIRHNSGKNYSD